MTRPALSVITVCMNRQQHLLATARTIAAWPLHQEHLILDWSSRVPVERAQLPPDPRIRLERVDGEQRWNLCRAYNLAARLARGRLLLKLDADCWPDQFDPSLLTGVDARVCRFGSGPDGRLGQFLMHRSAFEAVGGFNEVLLGYGFDDKDLKARHGMAQKRLADLRDWQGFATVPKRQSLCESMEALAAAECTDAPARAEAVKALQEEWKALGRSDSPVEQRLWRRFRKAASRSSRMRFAKFIAKFNFDCKIYTPEIQWTETCFLDNI